MVGQGVEQGCRLLFLLILVGLPIVDIVSLIEVGDRIGVWPTVALVVLAAVAGSALMRAQGFALLGQAQETLAAGRFPARELFDGLCVLVGGALLMWPGFVSDLAGLLLLTPPFRAMMRRLIGAQMERSGRFVLWTANTSRTAPGRQWRPIDDAGPGDRRRVRAGGRARRIRATAAAPGMPAAGCNRRGSGRTRPRLSRPTIRDSPRGVCRNVEWQGKR